MFVKYNKNQGGKEVLLYVLIFGYIIMNLYLSRELAMMLSIEGIKTKIVYYTLYFTASLSYFFSRIFLTKSANEWTDLLTSVLGHAMPTSFYAMLLLIMYKVCHLVYYKLTGAHFPWQSKCAFYALLVVLVVLNIYGYYNATNPVLTQYSIGVNKNIKVEKIRVVIASDLHLGKNTNKQYMSDLVNTVNAQGADLVLLLGDIVDSDVDSVVRKELFAPLNDVVSKYGVYAVMGNHEYISKEPLRIIGLLKQQNVNVLVDDSVYLSELNLGIVGLNDIGHRSVGENDTKTIHWLFSKIPQDALWVLADHQPKRISVAKDNGVDLALSGHTHRGQYYPIGYITESMFKNDWGLKKFGDMYSLVSCGYGNWGANMRLGSRTELVVLDVFRQ